MVPAGIQSKLEHEKPTKNLFTGSQNLSISCPATGITLKLSIPGYPQFRMLLVCETGLIYVKRKLSLEDFE